MKLARHGTPAFLVFACLLAGCSGGATTTASSAALGSSTAPGSSAAANQEPLKKGLLGGLELTEMKSEVESRSDKKKIAFSIELPEGMKDFSDAGFAGMKSFSKVKQDLADMTTFDGYSFSVMEAHPQMVKAGLEETLARSKGDFEKNKGKILDKGTNSDGFWFVASIEEKDKKAVISTGIVTKGEGAAMSLRPSRDRDPTDGSLREERDETDRAIAERQAAVQVDANELVQRARDNADAALTAGRDNADQGLPTSTSGVPALSVVGRRRAVSVHPNRDGGRLAVRPLEHRLLEPQT